MSFLRNNKVCRIWRDLLLVRRLHDQGRSGDEWRRLLQILFAVVEFGHQGSADRTYISCSIVKGASIWREKLWWHGSRPGRSVCTAVSWPPGETATIVKTSILSARGLAVGPSLSQTHLEISIVAGTLLVAWWYRVCARSGWPPVSVSYDWAR